MFDKAEISYFTFNQGVNSIKDVFTRMKWKGLFQKQTVLNDLSFTIPKGAAVGVLGRNGAGKSSLLKAVAGMLFPSSGHIEVNGRVAPILAVGAGIEMELSGYENIDLTANLLGFDVHDRNAFKRNVAQFSELSDEVLNRPIKTYSTGMLSRLSFSIAVADKPDILIVDEVLAVGDQGFQQKCIQRIQDIKQAGCTLLFVSHNPDEVRKVCDKVLFLNQGKLEYYGALNTGIDHYESLFKA